MTKTLRFLPLALVALGLACSREPNLDKVAPGADVQVTRADGALIDGKVARVEPEAVVLTAGPRDVSVPRKDITHVALVEAGKETPIPDSAKFREFTIPAGTTIAARLEESATSDRSKAGEKVRATLASPVRVSGTEVLPVGAVISGHVESVEPAGKVKGRARLLLTFDKLVVNDASYAIDARVSRVAAATKAEDAAKIAIPAAGGAIIGGLLGGKKGAVVGTVIGGGAGAAVVLNTTGDNVGFAAGSVMNLTLADQVEVRVPIVRPNGTK